MTATITAGPNCAVIIRDGNRVISMTSSDPWYRLFRALADLFIAGEIDTERLSRSIPHDHPEIYPCPAARHVLSSIYLTIDEPSCPCDPYREKPCNCPPTTDDDRRARLQELIGA